MLLRSSVPPLRQPFPRLRRAGSATAARAQLSGQLTLVAAWCKRAIARGWDSGRISFAGDSAVPFEREVAAMLDGSSGRATSQVCEAAERVRALEAERPGAELTPLDACIEEHGLSPRAARILLAVTAPLLRGELARIYSIITNDPARPLCDELLLAHLFDADEHERLAISRELDPDAPLLRARLIVVGAGTRPFASLTVSPTVVRRIAGVTDLGSLQGVTRRTADRSLDELLLPDELRRHIALAFARPPSPSLRLVVCGRPGSGRKALVAALAHESDRELGIIDVGGLGRDVDLCDRLESLLGDVAGCGWIPCLEGLDHLTADDVTLQGRLRALLRAHAGPLAFIVQVAPPALDPNHVLLTLAPLVEHERLDAWRRALAQHRLDVAAAETLSLKYRVGAGTIERVTAAADGAEAGPALVSSLELQLRQHRKARIGATASPVMRLPTWDNVILPDDVIESVQEFVSRARNRRRVFGEWGFDGLVTSGRGLTALFTGGPGTGKSMVAGVVARELGYELYRVDLSRVLSKWIGETEKNLAAVFDAADEGEVMLLFDEADSLFARRTAEVKSSNDRYANVETNYLLERLDTFEGIAILTTNSMSAIDPAFKRRLSLRLQFPFPDEELRERIWRAHLPRELPIDGALDLKKLAQRFKLSGAYIRNAVLRAAFIAAEEAGPLNQEHLERAVSREYREVGKVSDCGVLE
jgi:hypothetical protein